MTPNDSLQDPGGATNLTPTKPTRRPQLRGWQLIRARLKRLTTKSPFWHSALTMLFMPALWRSGIKMRMTPTHFEAVLPFTRNNRNYDGNMSGAALLGSCEVAAGGYPFHLAEGQFSVVCKKLIYNFRRPCNGPAEYRVRLDDRLQATIDAGMPFTTDLEVEIFERRAHGEEPRQIGNAAATFYARPLGYPRSRDRAKGAV